MHAAAVSLNHLAVWDPWLLDTAACNKSFEAPTSCNQQKIQLTCTFDLTLSGSHIRYTYLHPRGSCELNLLRLICGDFGNLRRPLGFWVNWVDIGQDVCDLRQLVQHDDCMQIQQELIWYAWKLNHLEVSAALEPFHDIRLIRALCLYMSCHLGAQDSIHVET